MALEHGRGWPDCSPREFFLNETLPCPPGVDKGATLREFGYSPCGLGPASKKKVVAVCEFCGSRYSTTRVCVGRHGPVACKRCDAVASAYSRAGGVGDKRKFFLARSTIPSAEKIDAVETERSYGHSIGSSAAYSTRMVVSKCDYCGVRVDLSLSKYTGRKGRVCCRSWDCIRKKTVETLEAKYGVKCTLSIPSVLEKLQDPTTEQLVASVLKVRYGVDFVRQHQVGPYAFDFFVPSANLLIECQGDYFHDFKSNGYSGTPRDRSKASYVENNTGYRLVWLWEHELHLGRINKVLDYHVRQMVEPVLEFGLSDLEFGPASNEEAHRFLSSYHYLGNLGTVATCWGAWNAGQLVAICVFGGVTRNQTIKKVNELLGTGHGPGQVRELRRLCVHPGAHVKNLVSFSMKRFLDLQVARHPETRVVISFSDPNVGDSGTVYSASNWRRVSITKKSYHYLDPASCRIVHKKTVWDLAKSAHMPESEFAIKVGLSRVEEGSKVQWMKIL